MSLPTSTRDAEKISQLNPMLARSSMTISPFLQLMIVLRPTNTPLPIVIPLLSVPFASRQHQAQCAGHPAGEQHRRFVREQRAEAGLADEQLAVLVPLRPLLVEELLLDDGDAGIVLALRR